MNAEQLLEHYDKVSDAPDAVARLRRFVVDLALRGKLVEQDLSDEPASVLLNRIAKEKVRLLKSGAIKSSDGAIQPADNQQFAELPKSWAFTTLASVSRRIHYGYTASADASLHDVRMLRITDIQDGDVDWSTVPGCIIDLDDVDQYKLAAGDILIARTGGTIGKTFLVGRVPVTSVFASYLIRVQSLGIVEERFIKLFFESSDYWAQLKDGTRGTGQPNVNGQTLGKLVLPLAPMGEQRRIVSKFDELMALCDQLEGSRAERESTRDRLAAASLTRLNVPDPDTFPADARFALSVLSDLTARADQIKQLRQTILNLAVRGKLVAQDPRDEPSTILIARLLKEKVQIAQAGDSDSRAIRESPKEGDAKQEELPVGWTRARLGDLCHLITKGSSPKWQGVNYVSADEGLLFITSENVGNYTLRKLDDLKYVDRKFRDIEPRSLLKRGDILMNLVGASIGRTALYDLSAEANINQAVALIRLVTVPDGLSVPYLLHYLNSPLAIRYMLGSRVTTAQPNMSLTDAREFPILIPPVAEQNRIVNAVDKFEKICDDLERGISSASQKRSNALSALFSLSQ